MGLSSDLKRVLRNVKKIPGLPEAVYKKLKGRLREIDRKLAKLDAGALNPKKIAEDVSKAITDTLGSQFEAIGAGFKEMENNFTEHLREMQAGFELALGRIKRDVSRIPKTIKDQFGEVRKWTRGLVDEMIAKVESMNPMDALSGLWTKYLPWIIAIVAIIMIPVFGPAIMGFLRLIF